MKIAVSSRDKDIGSEVDPRFGRCRYFLIIDSDTFDFEAHENPGAQAGGGAGPLAVQFIIGKGAEAVVTGDVGPNAYETLKAAGIKVFTGAAGSVKESVEKFKSSLLNEPGGPTAKRHAGIG